MRIAAFSDIHGNLAALEAVLGDIERHEPDHLVCLGDLVAEGPHPRQVIARIRDLGCTLVQGNCDTWHKEPLPPDWKPADERQKRTIDWYLWLRDQLGPEELDYLHNLPFQQCIGPVLCVHGSPRGLREAIFPGTPEEELAAMIADVPSEIEVILCGHTHLPMRRCIGDITVVGVGSVGMPADGDWRPCYAVLELTRQGWHVTWQRPAYDIDDAVAAAQSRGLPHVQAIGKAWRSGLGLAG